jgi:hypothetical protein
MTPSTLDAAASESILIDSSGKDMLLACVMEVRWRVNDVCASYNRDREVLMRVLVEFVHG